MQQCEQHADHNRQDKAEIDVVINQLGDQQSAEQRAEQTEAHRNQQRNLLECAADSPDAVSGNCTGEDDAVGEHAQHDRRVDIGERRR